MTTNLCDMRGRTCVYWKGVSNPAFSLLTPACSAYRDGSSEETTERDFDCHNTRTTSSRIETRFNPGKQTNIEGLYWVEARAAFEHLLVSAFGHFEIPPVEV